jgi:hypothetical protein
LGGGANPKAKQANAESVMPGYDLNPGEMSTVVAYLMALPEMVLSPESSG